jgi:hypothetical protein
VLSYRRGWPAFAITAGALLLVLATIVLTVTQLEPINRLADAWNPDQPPAGWTALRERWLALHAVRTAIAVLAFAGLLAAQLVDRRRAAVTTRDSSVSWYA